MKKMKGVAFANTIESSYEDSRAGITFQELFRDFEDLIKENEASRSRLEMMKQKKKTLIAEVRFLRRRYNYLKQTRSQNSAVVRNCVQTQKAATGGKSVRREKNSIANGAAALRPPVPRFDLNQKGKIQSEREAIFRSPALSSEVMIKKQKAYSGKDIALRNSLLSRDLNQKERKEATAPKTTPIFDLNRISGEEEGLQENCEEMRIEEPKLTSVMGASDDQLNDIRLSVCRNIGTGSSQAGKRKISWQDQVALRV